MATYIKSGSMHKLLMSPSVTVRGPEFLVNEIEAEALEIELERLRPQMRYANGMGKPANLEVFERVRELRRLLSKADARAFTILVRDNPEWAIHWGYTESGQ